MKFSFVKANASKILLLPLYVLGGLLAHLSPRNPKLWVFGRKPGFGEGPLRVLQEMRRRHPGFRLVWMAQDERDRVAAEKEGVDCVKRASLRGFWLTLRAGSIVITHGLGDVCRPAAPGARIIQLWHGTPLKLISLDSPLTYRFGSGFFGRIVGKIMHFSYAKAFRMPRAYLAASVVSQQRFQSAFGIARDRILLIGDPRCDCLHAESPQRAADGARAMLAGIWGVESLPRRIYLYAPTWRDGEPDPGIPSGAQLGQIADMCERHNAWLVIRSHPWGHGSDALLGQGDVPSCIRFLPSGVINDVTPLLHAFDGLITDYSAIAIDYSLFERPLYFFAPDLAGYVATRGLYESYDEFTNGDWSSCWEGVIDQIEADMDDAASFDRRCQRSRVIKGRYHAYDDGAASERLVSWATGRGDGASQ